MHNISKWTDVLMKLILLKINILEYTEKNIIYLNPHSIKAWLSFSFEKVEEIFKIVLFSNY